MPASLDSVTLVASDFVRSLAFYDAALAPLGLVRAAEFGDEEEDDAQLEAVGWADGDAPPQLWLVSGANATCGVHLRLRAQSRAAVEAFFAAALRAGGVASAEPRRWVVFRRGDFVAAVRDPEGNVVEAVAVE
ncbi:MAG TPA: VOC family protein [Jatrophihabitantaceae bacterium]|nr:VOC family protein [Jatrophihabitantaceae bacterium]